MKTRIELRVVIYEDDRELAEKIEQNIRGVIKFAYNKVYIETLVDQDEE